MKRNTIYAALCGIAFTVCTPCQGQTQETNDSTDMFWRHLQLNEVVVTGVTGDTKLKHTPSAVSLLRSKDLRQIPSTNIVDAIAKLPGLSQITTGGGISNAYGLSIYFPYKKTGNVSKAVSTYKAIGMDDEYTRCIQEFASLEVSGQLSSGSTPQSYGSSNAMSGLMESLMGGGSSYSSIGSGYSSDSLESLLGGYFGGSSGGSTGSILDLLIGRSITAETAAEYIQENHFDPSSLQWQNGRISLTDDQWGNLLSIEKNLFYDDGEGYIDMGFDANVEFQGHDLIYEFDGTWLSIDRQPVAYYRIGYVEQEECFAEVGYVPAYVNGIRANLIIVFDQDNPYGYIAGASPVYLNGETDAQAKNLVGIGKGDQIQFVCDYYDYQGNYKDSYKLGSAITLGDETEIGNTYVDAEKCRLTYCMTDIYQQQYWTPVK